MRLIASFIMALWLMGALALALTPKERKLAEHAQAGIIEGLQHNDALAEQLGAANQAAADSAASANAAGDRALTAEAQAKTEHANLVTCASENAKMRPVFEEVNKYWGIGGILYGFKRLAVHMLILTAVIVVLAILVMVFIPAVIPFVRAGFSIALRFLTWLEEAIAALLARIFHRSTPAAPVPAPAPTTGPVVEQPTLAAMLDHLANRPTERELPRTEIAAVAATVPKKAATPRKKPHVRKKPSQKKIRRTRRPSRRAIRSRGRAR